MDKNGGKLPSDYKSAFDKWREKQPKTVAPLMDEDEFDEDEFPETDMSPVWHVSQCGPITATPLCGVSEGPNFEHIN